MTGDRHARELVDRWQRHADARARAELVSLYQPLVAKWVRRYPGAQIHRDDATQEARIGLLTAIDRFDPDRGTLFSTYATVWIRNALLAFVRRQSLVRLTGSRKARDLFFSLGKHARELARRGEDPTPEAIAANAGVDAEVARRVLASAYAADVWLDAPASSSGGELRTHLDLLEDAGAPADELLDAARFAAAAAAAVQLAEGQLTGRELVILRRRHLTEEPASLREIGEQLGLTGERVRQLEARMLKKIAQLARAGRAA